MEYKIEPGEMAPDFTLPRTDGKNVRLYDCKNKKTVLLFFFNHEDERCLTRLSSLGRDYQQFRDAGAVIFPISIMPVDEGKKLHRQLSLPFPLLCDSDHSIAHIYRVGQCSSEPAHVCFEIISHVTDPQMLIVDPSGIIRSKHHLYTPGSHPDNQALIIECRNALR